MVPVWRGANKRFSDVDGIGMNLMVGYARQERYFEMKEN
jgi:hypothetical protein